MITRRIFANTSAHQSLFWTRKGARQYHCKGLPSRHAAAHGFQARNTTWSSARSFWEALFQQGVLKPSSRALWTTCHVRRNTDCHISLAITRKHPSSHHPKCPNPCARDRAIAHHCRDLGRIDKIRSWQRWYIMTAHSWFRDQEPEDSLP